MWRYAERYDIPDGCYGCPFCARGLIARLVADGERNTHEWTDAKNEMYKAFDESVSLLPVWICPAAVLLTALVTWLWLQSPTSLSWVDGGASTTSLVNNLALGPIVEKGTPEQKQRYMSLCAPAQPGEDRKTWRGAFALTEPLPYVGVDTGVLCGKVSVAEWNEGEEPMLAG